MTHNYTKGSDNTDPKKIAIIGGGPSGLHVFKTLINSSLNGYSIHIFESKDKLGMGMPYSKLGACNEHITNVSGNEIPELVTSVAEWIKEVPTALLNEFGIERDTFHEYKVLPRLLFGEYLRHQFDLLISMAKEKNIETRVFLNTKVTDMIDLPHSGYVIVECDHSYSAAYQRAIICTGHYWPVTREGKVPGYFDAPYPPSKLAQISGHPVAIRGSGLTAIDAIRTLARNNGRFIKKDEKTIFEINNDAKGFKIVLHSIKGLLPAVRFHLEDPHLSAKSLLTPEEIERHIRKNNGFLSLDFIFEKDFKEILKQQHSSLYDVIKDMALEVFVENVMKMREEKDPFELFAMEYKEADISIGKRKSVYWKELLAILSFEMNYPAKHFSAEDMLRLQHVLKPLISVVIAFVPQDSCEELLALHDAGLLEMVPVDKESKVEPVESGGINYHYDDEHGNAISTFYKTYVNCTGQRPLSMDEFYFKSLLEHGSVSAATLPFRNDDEAKTLLEDGNKDVIKDAAGNYHLRVDGIKITDNFNIVNDKNIANPRIYLMAVPYIGGYNPDYSGLDFCEHASELIVADLEKNIDQLSGTEQILKKAS